ncbi:MAG TPA: MATE family efflux transporter [Thermoanaerobaculia bacterium]|nr:MATE family efflux transporter [Thermoanaerobaculia bacterium]
MLTKERVGTIFKLALPIGVAVSSTLIMSLVDLAMVAPLGNHATAAVGLSVFTHTLLLSLVAGIGPAVQGLVARRRGQGSTEPKCLPLNGGLMGAVLAGIPLTILGYFMAPIVLGLISSDPEVTRIGIPFLRVLYMALIAAGMNFSFKGHWAGMERPNIYMMIILFMNVLNFCGNWVLIHGRFGFPALGATGAALSTAFASYVGVFINMIIAWPRFRHEGFLTAWPGKKLLVRIFTLGLPAGMQDFFFSAGYIVFYWIVGQVGTAELAAVNVQVRISLLLSIVAMALGSASATLVSRTIGQGDPAGAAQWGWDAGKLGVIVITLLAAPLVIFARFFLAVFLSDPHTIEIALLPWQIVTSLAGLGSLIYIFAYTLVSVGDGSRVAIISFGTQWLLFLPAVWFVGPYLHYGLLQISLVQVVYGTIATILITSIWADGRWKKIKI